MLKFRIQLCLRWSCWKRVFFDSAVEARARQREKGEKTEPLWHGHSEGEREGRKTEREREKRETARGRVSELILSLPQMSACAGFSCHREELVILS